MKGMITRRGILQGGAATLALPVGTAVAAWPEKPIVIQHGFAAGGNADVVARIVADALAGVVKGQFVVEPKPGAGGTIAATAVSRAANDGHTLGILPGGHAVSAALYKKLNYDPIDDFTWISMVSEFPFVIATHAESPIKTLAGLLDRARKAAEPPLWGTAGNGTGQHMAGELLASMAGVKMKHVPYRGGAPAVLDLLGGRLDIVIETATALGEHFKTGKLRALAVTGPKRFFAVPDVPTVAEAGLPGYETTSWLGLAGPKGISPETTAKLNKSLEQILNDPKTADRLKAIGGAPAPMSPEAFRQRVSVDVEKWKKVVEAAGIPRI